MNFLDIFMIILAIGIFIGAIAVLISGVKWDELFLAIGLALCVAGLEFLPILYFAALDRGSGSTIGTITSVDKNFFGTTALYIKTSENSQEEYCIENENVIVIAKNMIGKNVKISYGERIGLYSTNKCHSAPIEQIEEVK